MMDLEVMTDDWFYTREIKIILSDYFNDIDGWNNYKKLGEKLYKNPKYRTSGISIDEYRKLKDGRLFNNNDRVNENKYLEYIISLDQKYKTKSVYKTCRYNSYLNTEVWRTLYFLYKNDSGYKRRSKILKIKSRM